MHELFWKVLKYKMILEKIEKAANKKIEKLYIVGGGSQNELLNQLTANATGKKVFAGPVEATALGNIIVQAIAKNRIESLDKAREIVSISFPLKTYMPRKNNVWETRMFETPDKLKNGNRKSK